MSEIKASTKVIVSLHPGFITVIVGYEYGHVNGGVIKDISIKNIPQDLRVPNSEFILVWDRQIGETIRAERLKQK